MPVRPRKPAAEREPLIAARLNISSLYRRGITMPMAVAVAPPAQRLAWLNDARILLRLAAGATEKSIARELKMPLAAVLKRRASIFKRVQKVIL